MGARSQLALYQRPVQRPPALPPHPYNKGITWTAGFNSTYDLIHIDSRARGSITSSPEETYVITHKTLPEQLIYESIQLTKQLISEST